MEIRNDPYGRLVFLCLVTNLRCWIYFQDIWNSRRWILLVTKQSGKKRRCLFPSPSGTMYEQNKLKSHLETTNRRHSVLHALMVIVVCRLHDICKERCCKSNKTGQHKGIDIVVSTNDIWYRNRLFCLWIMGFSSFRFLLGRIGNGRHNRVHIACSLRFYIHHTSLILQMIIQHCVVDVSLLPLGRIDSIRFRGILRKRKD